MTIRDSKATETLELLANDYNLYTVSYRYSENIFCSNIVIADKEEDIERAYSEYRNLAYGHISMNSARYEIEKKHKPLVIA